MRIIFYIAALFSIIQLSCSTLKENPEITESELSGHIEFLASDSLKGRYPGTLEDLVAARYIAQEFSKAGITWFTPDGLQPFQIITKLEAGENNAVQFNDFIGVEGEDFVPAPFTSNSTHSAEVLFAGYGFDINTEEITWNDYENFNPNGKWIMVLRGNPELDNSMSPFNPYSGARDKAMLAKDKGAGGLILVSGESFGPEDDLLTLKSRESSAGIPVIHIKRDVADKILSPTGNSIKKLESKLNSDRKPVSFLTGTSLSATTEVNPSKDTTYNVVGYLEGVHPEKKHEVIVLGAHYDHLGLGGPGTTSRARDTLAPHYGADDNASGVAAMIEIAEKLALSPDQHDRSFLFVAFGAEELGLLGSMYFVDHSYKPAEDINLMVNLDMIGRMRSKKLQINGIGTALESEALITELAKDSFDLILNPEGFGASDHSSFYDKDIPVLFLTTGVHADYHKPDDRPEMINYSDLVLTAEFTYNVLDSVSNMDAVLTFQEAGPKVQYTARYGRGKIALGIMPDITSTDDTEGMRVEFVTPGKPAERGGMKKGDIIISIEGESVNNVYDYMYRLEKLEKGQLIVVKVKRNEEKIDLLIQL